MGDQRKLVGFVNEPDQDIPPRFLVLTEDLLNDTWYSNADFKRFRSDAQSVSCRIRNKQSGSYTEVSYTDTLASIHASCYRGHFPKNGDMGSLAAWFAVGASRRGLEHRSLDKRTRLDRKIHNHLAIGRVLKAQMMEFVDSDTKEDFIRKVYKQTSSPARVFALALAKASEVSSNINPSCTEEYPPPYVEVHGCASRAHEFQSSDRLSVYRCLHRGSSIHHVPLHGLSHRQLRRAST